MRTRASQRCLTALITSFGISAACAQDTVQTPSGIDDIGYQIEIGLHARLAEVRASGENKLSPFKSDGCSGGLSAGWKLLAQALPELARRHGGQPPWQHCCVVHDRAYHTGGGLYADAKTSYEARRRVDEQLRQCVIRTGQKRVSSLRFRYGLTREQVTSLYRNIADAMYRAVRLGGVPCTGLPWRWGFGWPRCDREYRPVQH
jgi:hypothetical protein